MSQRVCGFLRDNFQNGEQWRFEKRDAAFINRGAGLGFSDGVGELKAGSLPRF
jgi:hypothetical protein